MKIILVDDEQKFVNMLAKRLNLRGIQTDVVFTGADAVAKISAEDYDIAVLDIKMPGISGYDLKQKLCSIQPDLKFIFVTGHGTVEQQDETIIQHDLYFSKPLNIETLIEKIHEISGEKK